MAGLLKITLGSSVKYAVWHRSSKCTGVAVSNPRLRLDLIRPKSFLCQQTIHHRVTESARVAAGLPNLGMHDDAGVEADDIIPVAGHGAPPSVLDVAFQL